MIFDGVRERTRKRLNEVQINLNHISLLEPQDPSIEMPIEVKIMKGLFYVHLYAAFEKNINDLVQTTLTEIASIKVKKSTILPPFTQF
jgi:hypothetical protein